MLSVFIDEKSFSLVSGDVFGKVMNWKSSGLEKNGHLYIFVDLFCRWEIILWNSWWEICEEQTIVQNEPVTA